MSAPNPRHLTWRKSSHSNGYGGECVEVAATGNAIAIRDSKVPERGSIVASSSGWSTLLKGIKPGGLDR
ncbi:DUF397 domain-containing protein [Actinomadura adrarensis]|uniref:DUF397 domain-containing protein n=1 Tax=Actinomadura adrarensis TaxID=1819600 RepID=A0ABW3CKV7_9ACTN